MTRFAAVLFALACLKQGLSASDFSSDIGVFYIKSMKNYCMLVLKNELTPIYYAQCLNSDLVLFTKEKIESQEGEAGRRIEYADFNGIFMDISLSPLNIQPYQLSTGSGLRMLRDGKVLHSLDEINEQFQSNGDSEFIFIEKMSVLPVLPSSISKVVEMIEWKIKGKKLEASQPNPPP